MKLWITASTSAINWKFGNFYSRLAAKVFVLGFKKIYSSLLLHFKFFETSLANYIGQLWGFVMPCCPRYWYIWMHLLSFFFANVFNVSVGNHNFFMMEVKICFSDPIIFGSSQFRGCTAVIRSVWLKKNQNTLYY